MSIYFKDPEGFEPFLELFLKAQRWTLPCGGIASWPLDLLGFSFWGIILVFTGFVPYVPHGSWFDHVKGWMSLNGQNNFLLVTYEELSQDLRAGVLKICKFLGEELDNDAINRVVEQASFKNMKENKMSNFGSLPDSFDQKKSPFLRKGITGDWKNHFTVTQSEYFDCVYREKMEGFTGMFPWDKN